MHKLIKRGAHPQRERDGAIEDANALELHKVLSAPKMQH
jgi:hypothetical protein